MSTMLALAAQRQVFAPAYATPTVQQYVSLGQEPVGGGTESFEAGVASGLTVKQIAMRNQLSFTVRAFVRGLEHSGNTGPFRPANLRNS